MSNVIGRVRTTSDLLLEDLEALRDLEEKKRAVPVGSPRFVELAEKVEELSRGILARTERQRDLGERASQELATSRSSAPSPTINDTPREISAILSEWRDAERRLAEAQPGTEAAEAASRDVIRLRAEYRSASDPSRRSGTERT